MGTMEKKRLKKRGRQSRNWICPVCGGAELKQASCPTCEAERIRPVVDDKDLNEGPLLRLHGKVSSLVWGIREEARDPELQDKETVPGPWQHSFELKLPNDKVIKIKCNLATRTLHDNDVHWFIALREGVTAEVLGRVKKDSQEQRGERCDSVRTLVMRRARIVAVDPEADERMRRAIVNLDEQGEPNIVASERSVPKGLRIEPIETPLGFTGIQITKLSSAFKLLGPRLIGPGTCLQLIFILVITGTAVDNLIFLIPLLVLGIMLTYFWIAILNRQIIRLDHETLSVSYLPLPWPGRRCPVTQVAQLDTFEWEPPPAPPSSSLRTYRADTLLALCTNGKVLSLLKKSDKWQVYFVQRNLEVALGLKKESKNPYGSED